MGSAEVVRKLHTAETDADIVDGEGRTTKAYQSMHPSKAPIEDAADSDAVPGDAS